MGRKKCSGTELPSSVFFILRHLPRSRFIRLGLGFIPPHYLARTRAMVPYELRATGPPSPSVRRAALRGSAVRPNNGALSANQEHFRVANDERRTIGLNQSKGSNGLCRTAFNNSSVDDLKPSRKNDSNIHCTSRRAGPAIILLPPPLISPAPRNPPASSCRRWSACRRRCRAAGGA